MTAGGRPPCTRRCSRRCITGRTSTWLTAGGSRRAATSSTRTPRSATAGSPSRRPPGPGSGCATPTAWTSRPARTTRSSSASRSAWTASTTTRSAGTRRYGASGLRYLGVGEGELAAQVAEHRVVFRVGLAVFRDELGGVLLRVVLRLVAQGAGLGERDPAAAGIGRDPEDDPEPGPFGGQARLEQPARVVRGQP